ncbi:hypothetical protein C0991_004791 [Blastosporella zonata]|nr:hypothetical protein C0991_004791 [Blastosporella zonata]
MVALSPRFAVLAGFISLASLSISPLLVGGVAIPNAVDNSNRAHSFNLGHLQSEFHLSQAKAVKRDDCSDQDLLCLYLAGARVLKRSQHSPHWSLKKHGKKYSVSHSSKHSHSYKHPKYHQGHVGRAEAQPEIGTIDIVSPSSSPEGKPIGHLYMEKKSEDAQDSATSYPVGASPTESTNFNLVRGSGMAPGDGDAMKLVQVQVPMTGKSGAAEVWCLGYEETESKNSDLSVSPCDESGKGGMRQTFGYDETTHNITPLQYAPQDSSSSAQSVVGRDDSAKDVVLRFTPQNTTQAATAADVTEPSAAAAPSNAGSLTSTMTTTVTVTNTPTATLSAADFAATPTTDASSSSVASLTSTTNSTTPTSAPVVTPGATGTAGAAGIMDVQVVQPSGTSSQPSGASSAMLTASSTAVSAAPTTMNAQDVAASIAGSSTAASVTATPATGLPSSSVRSGVASSSVSVPSPSSAPNVRAVGTEPYKWVFKRE